MRDLSFARSRRIAFEGAGDALFAVTPSLPDTAFEAMLGPPADWANASCRHSGRIDRSLLLPSRHVFLPLIIDEAIYYPAAFDDYGRAALKAGVPTLIEVSAEEARRFACNAVVVGKTVVTNTGCSNLHQQLHRHGFLPMKRHLMNSLKPEAVPNALLTARWRGSSRLEAFREQRSFVTVR